MDLNRVIIVGRVTADPQLRTTPSGTSVATMGVATNRTWNDKDGKSQETVEFHNVVLWGRQAEIATNYLTKGSLVLVEGRLQTRTWEDKDGTARRTTEIVAEHIQLGPKPEGKSAAKNGPTLSPDSLVPPPDRSMPIIDLDGDEEDSGREMEKIPF